MRCAVTNGTLQFHRNTFEKAVLLVATRLGVVRLHQISPKSNDPNVILSKVCFKILVTKLNSISTEFSDKNSEIDSKTIFAVITNQPLSQK